MAYLTLSASVACAYVSGKIAEEGNLLGPGAGDGLSLVKAPFEIGVHSKSVAVLEPNSPIALFCVGSRSHPPIKTCCCRRA